MLTGIELAGLVLAAFPLVISVLEHYRDGFETVESWWTFRTEFTGFIIDLGTQLAIFDENLELLLSPFVTDEAVFAKLLEDPGGALWKDPTLEKQLRQRLPKTYDIYMELVGKMYDTLTALQKKLGIENGQFKMGTDSQKSGFKWSYQLRKLKFTFGKKTREKHLQVIEAHNKKLKTLLGASDKLAPHRQKRPKNTSRASYFAQVQAHAVALSAVLRTAWKCSCTAPHITKLLLEQRIHCDTGDEMVFNALFSRLPRPPDLTGQWVPVRIRVAANLADANPRLATPESPSPASSPRAVQFVTNSPRRSTSSRSYRPSSVASAPASASRVASRSLRTPSISQTSDLTELHRNRSSSSSTTGASTMISRTFSGSSRVRSDSLSTAPTSVMSMPTTPPTLNSPAKESLGLSPAIQERAEKTQAAIQDLCEAVNLPLDEPTHLGYFDHEAKSVNLHTTDSILAMQPKTPVVSLADILTAGSPSHKSFSRRDRLHTGVTLACSMLQLHTCKWTDEPWSKSDLYLMLNTTSTPAGQSSTSAPPSESLAGTPSPEKLYIATSFPSTGDASNTNTAQTRSNNDNGEAPPRTPQAAARGALLSLGILLLELVFKAPLESHPAYRALCSSDGRPNDFTPLVTARRWSDEDALGEAGPEFADVVRRCLDCSFGPRPDLADAAFREAVWQDVVVPLREMLSVFDGG